MSDSYFSESYHDARRRFRAAADEAGASLHAYPIEVEGEEDLTIDVAVLGDDDLPTVLTSIGIHGVEGFFGSAVQLALLDRWKNTKGQGSVRHVLLHGINPFGFLRLRRFNEDNVDLNRNFCDDGEGYSGAPDAYVKLNGFLNPASPPSRWEPFEIKAIGNILRSGYHTLKQAVAGGQYQYPQGLFFGGHSRCQSTQVICENCDQWIGQSKQIMHLDFHSGLGRNGAYKLLLAESADSEHFSWYTEQFGADHVEPLDTPEGTAYKVSGLMGDWLQRHFASREYRFMGAEVGTYGAIRILKALRAENRAHHYCEPDSEIYKLTKAELLECFCPSDPSWQARVVRSGLAIIDRAADAIRGVPLNSPWSFNE